MFLCPTIHQKVCEFVRYQIQFNEVDTLICFDVCFSVLCSFLTVFMDQNTQHDAEELSTVQLHVFRSEWKNSVSNFADYQGLRRLIIT